jgi:hypothetical protein
MNVIARFLDICLLKAGPQDIPASTWLMKIVLLSYFLIATVSQLFEYSLVMSLAAALAELLLLVVFVKAVLTLRGYKARFNQTVTAIAGTGCLISLIALPLVHIASTIIPEDISSMDSIIMLLVMLVLLWSLMVTAHIFRQAFEIKVGIAVILTVIYTFLTLIAVGLAMSGAVN